MSEQLSDLNTCKNQGHLRTSYFKCTSSVESSIMGRGVKKMPQALPMSALGKKE